MTRKELQELAVGTMLYNGRVEGIIVYDCGVKSIQVLIPICTMSDTAGAYDERPANWEPLEE